MSLSAIRNKVTSKIGRQVLVTQKHSPTLLFVTGVVGLGATVVLASRATLKMDEILREAEENSKRIDAALAVGDEDYTEEERNKDVALNKAKLIIKIAKLYAPAFATGVITVGALTGSHIILNRRNAALTAAYTVVDQSFKEYRQRVIGEYGKEKDQEFRFGVVEREIAVDTDEGVGVKTVKGADPKVAEKNDGKSMYARVFDESNKNWEPKYTYNQMFLQSQQNYANDRLRRDGYLFLNDVYEMLGYERTNYGQIVGWVKDGADGFVDFGILDNGYESRLFINGDERSVWLDFNVDGVIWDKI